MSKFSEEIADHVRERMLTPEVFARRQARVFWVKKAADPDYTTFVAEHPDYEDAVPAVYTTLTAAMAATRHDDRILLFGGDWTGNYTTPANTVARNVSVIALGAATSGVTGRAWAGATTGSSPIFTIQARGWRISGIELVPGSTSSAITLSGTNANYFQVDNCSTWTGKYFLLHEGTHFVKVLNNHVTNLNATGSIGIGCLTGIGGQHWDVRDNFFSDNYSHINFGSSRGLFGSRIQGNIFVKGGVWRTATVLLDNRNTSDTGGCAIVGNYFDCTKTQYGDDSSTAFIRTQSRDFGAGNMCNDGVPAADISH